MKIFKIIVQIEENGTICACDAIEHEGLLWLVTSWIEGPTRASEQPERIICMSGLPLDRPGPQYQVDWILNMPMSIDVLVGRKTAQNLLWIDRPEIFRNVERKFQS
jgi:hypothetical protein